MPGGMTVALNYKTFAKTERPGYDVTFTSIPASGPQSIARPRASDSPFVG